MRGREGCEGGESRAGSRGRGASRAAGGAASEYGGEGGARRGVRRGRGVAGAALRGRMAISMLPRGRETGSAAGQFVPLERYELRASPQVAAAGACTRPERRVRSFLEFEATDIWVLPSQKPHGAARTRAEPRAPRVPRARGCPSGRSGRGTGGARSRSRGKLRHRVPLSQTSRRRSCVSAVPGCGTRPALRKISVELGVNDPRRMTSLASARRCVARTPTWETNWLCHGPVRTAWEVRSSWLSDNARRRSGASGE